MIYFLRMNKKGLSALAVILIFLSVSFGLIAYARGVRFDFKNKKITSTGLLVATSNPDGAAVFIDDHLTTATNTTINLNPGDYKVKIAKEGFLPWQKNLKIQKEVVTKTDATLFPSTPELKPLTVNGSSNPSLSTDGTKIVYAVKTTEENTIDAERNGLYVLDLSDRPLSLTRSTRRIAKNTTFYDYSKAKILWSPDSKNILALFLNDQTKEGKNDSLLTNTTVYSIDPLSIDTALSIQADNEATPKDVTLTISQILNEWQEEQNLKYHDQLSSLPSEFLQIATTSTGLLRFSPDETKVLYTATASAQLPLIIKPALIGTNTQPETRELKSKEVYVYDIKEDKNFKINLKPRSNNVLNDLIWHPSSRHFIYVEKDAISIVEYDMTNKMTVYAGPFEDSYVFPWPNGSKLVILTTLNKSTGETNLYGLGLR